MGEPTERVGGHAVLSDGTAVFVPLGDAIDVGRECDRLGGEVERLLKMVDAQERKLSNEQFIIAGAGRRGGAGAGEAGHVAGAARGAGAQA